MGNVRAKEVIIEKMHSAGIDTNADFHTLSSLQVETIVELADLWRYRKPRNANGSRARYFFAFMARKPKTEVVHYVQGHYAQGWEDLAGSVKRSDAVRDLKDYRENMPETAYRLISRREKS